MVVDSALKPLLDLQSGDTPTEETWMPGLPTLREQQRELVDSLRDGFASRREILLWTHAVAVLSFGHVDDDWSLRLLSDRYRVAALFADADDRDALTPHPPGDQQADYIRDEIQQNALSPAFQAARAEIRGSGSDFTDEDKQPGDPSSQRFIGMRPRLHQVAVAQHRALREAFDEHDSRSAVLDWADDLDYATLGYLPEDFSASVASPSSDWWAVLTGPTRGVWLELRLAETVFPAAAQALRDAMQSGTERPDTLRESSVPSG